MVNSTHGNNFINNGLVTSGFFNPQKDNVVVWDVSHQFTRKHAYKWISPPTDDKSRSSVFLFKAPDGIQAGDVVQSPTFCNTDQDMEDIVRAVMDVIKAMKTGVLANNMVNRACV